MTVGVVLGNLLKLLFFKMVNKQGNVNELEPEIWSDLLRVHIRYANFIPPNSSGSNQEAA